MSYSFFLFLLKTNDKKLKTIVDLIFFLKANNILYKCEYFIRCLLFKEAPKISGQQVTHIHPCEST